MKTLDRNTKVRVKKGAEIGGYFFTGGSFKHIAGRDYCVFIIQHYVDNTRNEVHWRARHGNWKFTDFSNVEVV